VLPIDQLDGLAMLSSAADRQALMALVAAVLDALPHPWRHQ
jgi:hypothetical protein